MSEFYNVKFWHTNNDGFHTQSEKLFYTNSRSAHQQIEKFANSHLKKLYKNVRIISVIYQ